MSILSWDLRNAMSTKPTKTASRFLVDDFKVDIGFEILIAGIEYLLLGGVAAFGSEYVAEETTVTFASCIPTLSN